MKVIILGAGQMLTNLIAGCEDAGAKIVGVFRYEKVRYPLIDRLIVDTFNPSKEFTYIKSHKLYEINARSANSAAFKKEVLRLNADLVIVGTWSEKIKKSIIDLPKLATVNVHPALLPRYRGPNPYLQSIKHLEKESGITFHLMDENFDTGAILLQKHIPIEETDTGVELRNKTATAAREGICELIKKLDEEIIIPVKQDEKYSSYFSHITEDDVMLDFSKSAEEVSAHIRALHPWYKCYFAYENKFFVPNPYQLEILDLKNIDTSPSTIFEKNDKEKSITVMCGDGKLLKMSGVKLYGLMNRLFTSFYIKHFVILLKLDKLIKKQGKINPCFFVMKSFLL
jgi:methionyl-tRNA formyltransferase